MIKGLSILVVDDETVIRDAMKHLLEHCGCEVEAFDNGPAALARLEQRSFDVVITDFSMPAMPGDQLVARIRARLPAQRIIMATAFVEEYKVFGTPYGSINGLLYKPFTFSDLKDAIDGVMGQAPPAELPGMPPTTDVTAAGGPTVLAPPKP